MGRSAIQALRTLPSLRWGRDSLRPCPSSLNLTKPLEDLKYKGKDPFSREPDLCLLTGSGGNLPLNSIQCITAKNWTLKSFHHLSIISKGPLTNQILEAMETITNQVLEAGGNYLTDFGPLHAPSPRDRVIDQNRHCRWSNAFVDKRVRFSCDFWALAALDGAHAPGLA